MPPRGLSPEVAAGLSFRPASFLHAWLVVRLGDVVLSLSSKWKIEREREIFFKIMEAILNE